MRRYRYLVIQFYGRLLCLYPTQFRADYADEMRDVFAMVVTEQKNALLLMALIAGELWDLPFNLLREHVRERRAKALILLAEEKIMTKTVIPIRAFRGMTWTLLAIFVLYCLLILLPYFYYQVNLLSFDAVRTGSYDPTGYLPFTDNVAGGVFYLLGLAIVVFGLPTVAAMGGVLALVLRRHWRQFQQSQRWWGSTALIAGVLILFITFSPLGQLMMVWFLD